MVFGWDGNAVYATADAVKGGMTNTDCPFLEKISIMDLNIRKSAGTNTVKTGRHSGMDLFTITQAKNGKGLMSDRRD